MTGSGETTERPFLVEVENASRLVFWLEAFVLALLASYFFYSDAWESVFAVFNLSLLLVLVLAISFALVSGITWRIFPGWNAIVSTAGFIAGLTLVGYSLFNYHSGSDPGMIYIPLATGIILSGMSIGILLTRGNPDARWIGSYTMWLFGLMLILFMPLNETASGIGTGYSERDEVIAYLGLMVSLFGAVTFIYEDMQKRVTGINLTVGEAKYIAGKYDEAVESYGKALKADYGNAYIWFSKGTALLRMGAYQDSFEALEKATRFNPGLSGAWDAKGVVLSHLKRFSEAEECHGKAIELGGGAVSWSNKGNTMTRAGKHETALEAYQMATKLNPSYEISWYNKARSLTMLKKFQEAVSAFDESIRLRPDFPEAWHQRGVALRDAERYGEALHSLTISIQLKPSYSPGWVERDALLREMREKAISETGVPVLGAPPSLPPEMAILEAPYIAEEKSLERMDDPELLRSAGLRLARTGDYPGAISLFDRALEKDPENMLVRVSKGMTCMRMGHLDTAISIFQELVEKKPDWVGPRFMRGLLLGQQGRYEEALSSLDEALSLQPKYADAWNLKGIILAARRDYSDAVDCFDHALDVNPRDAEAWRSKGKALDRMGLYEEAVKCYEKALVIEPGVEEARTYVDVQRKRLRTADELFNQGVQLAKVGRNTEALDSLERCLILRPSYTEAMYIKGVVHGIKKEYFSAMECFKSVLEKKKDDKEALFGLASAQSKQGIYKDAVDTFTEVLRLDPDYADAWCEKGYALCELCRYEEGIQALDHALSLDADNEKAARYREKCACEIRGEE